eukprot:14180026-Alexandrium_andersonii.AAC.1
MRVSTGSGSRVVARFSTADGCNFDLAVDVEIRGVVVGRARAAAAVIEADLQVRFNATGISKNFCVLAPGFREPHVAAGGQGQSYLADAAREWARHFAMDEGALLR